METNGEHLHESAPTSVGITWSKKILVGAFTGKGNGNDLSFILKKVFDKELPTFTDRKIFFMLIKTNLLAANEIYELPLYIGKLTRINSNIKLNDEIDHERACDWILKNSAYKNLFVKFGMITYCNVPKDTKNIYEDVENCLLYSSRPVWTKKNKTKCGRNICLTNHGQYIPLKPTYHYVRTMDSIYSKKTYAIY